MEITVKGTHRKAIIELDSLNTHKNTIEHWLNGADVEEYEGSMWVSTSKKPEFLTTIEYRAVNILPKAGEVWEDEKFFYLATNNKSFISLCGTNTLDSFNGNWPKGLSYIAPSTDIHLTRRLIKKGPDTTVEFMRYVKNIAKATE